VKESTAAARDIAGGEGPESVQLCHSRQKLCPPMSVTSATTSTSEWQPPSLSPAWVCCGLRDAGELRTLALSASTRGRHDGAGEGRDLWRQVRQDRQHWVWSCKAVHDPIHSQPTKMLMSPSKLSYCGLPAVLDTTARVACAALVLSLILSLVIACPYGSPGLLAG
jgi:hypothetical protein